MAYVAPRLASPISVNTAAARFITSQRASFHNKYDKVPESLRLVRLMANNLVATFRKMDQVAIPL